MHIGRLKIDWVGKLAVRKMRLPGRTMKVSQPLDCNLTECSNVDVVIRILEYIMNESVSTSRLQPNSNVAI